MLTGANEPMPVESAAQAMAKVRRQLKTATIPFISFHCSYKTFCSVIANVM
jgi:hypothetical protein